LPALQGGDPQINFTEILTVGSYTAHPFLSSTDDL